MKKQIYLTIDCGETTCDNENGDRCKFLRCLAGCPTCALFGGLDHDSGNLAVRHPDCIANQLDDED